MDNRNSQIFGCFIGILATLVITQILFAIIKVSLGVEYVIFAALAVVLGLGGIGLVKVISRTPRGGVRQGQQ